MLLIIWQLDKSWNFNFQPNVFDKLMRTSPADHNKQSSQQYTPDEIMVVCIARQIRDGEVVAQGLGTPLVAAGYLLARKTHAPNLYFASAIGQTVCNQPAPLKLLQVEKLWLDRAIINLGFVRAVADVLPRLRPKEFFRPGQVDQFGNFNNIAFGRDYRHPRLRLPGTGGIPDVTTFIDDIYLYVPRHSRVTFVPKLDFLSGLGHNKNRTHGSGPPYLISDLGQFDFGGNPPENRMRLISYHAGSSIKQIQAKTGFELEISPDVEETPPPTEEELRILRQEIDPQGIRQLELLRGSQRRSLLHKIIEAEEREIRH
jgi:acyl CoA:acetate/3-ketoacid CoA transferase beta subunit